MEKIELFGITGQLDLYVRGGIRMWWVSFLSGCLVGGVAALFLIAIIIVGTEEDRHGRR